MKTNALIITGNQWKRHSWYPACTQKWRAGSTVWEDQDPAVYTEQGRDPVQPETGRYPCAEIGDQETTTRERNPAEECCQCWGFEVRVFISFNW